MGDLVGALKGLERLAEAGELEVDPADGQVDQARRRALVAVVVQAARGGKKAFQMLLLR